jgi:hypothetical protein
VILNFFPVAVIDSKSILNDIWVSSRLEFSVLGTPIVEGGDYFLRIGSQGGFLHHEV